MREIKFRAYDVRKKIMTDGFDQRHTLYISFSGEVSQFYSENDGSREMQTVGDLILMQCTSLKDKNGKEIYEGDIVRMKKLDGKFTTAKIVWDISTFECGYDWEGIYGDDGLHDYGGGASTFRPENLEVIGNIFENPELQP